MLWLPVDRLVVVGAKAAWREGSPLEVVSSGFDEEVKGGQALLWDAAQLLGSTKTAKKSKGKPSDAGQQSGGIS